MRSAEADRHPEAGQTHSAVLFRAQDTTTVDSSKGAGAKAIVSIDKGQKGVEHRLKTRGNAGKIHRGVNKVSSLGSRVIVPTNLK